MVDITSKLQDHEITMEMRLALCKEIQEIDRNRRQAFKWRMPTKSAAGDVAPVSRLEIKDGDVLAELDRLPTNIYAAAINAAIGAPGNGGVNGGEPPARKAQLPHAPIVAPKKIEVRPGETLLDAARRTLKEQNGNG
jgi:hypothetical protein